MVSATVVISSAGGAAQHLGGLLGQYENDEDKGFYVQTSTEQSNKMFEAVYLYREKDDKWWVGHTPGQKTGWLHNPRPSKTPPTIGWQYWDDGGKSWKVDLTLTVSYGPLPRQFTVTATGAAAVKWQGILGVFTRTEMWWNGRQVYVNRQGQFLHHGAGDAGWMIGPTIGKYYLKGTGASYSPASQKGWRYWTGSRDKPASVTVKVTDVN